MNLTKELLNLLEKKSSTSSFFAEFDSESGKWCIFKTGDKTPIDSFDDEHEAKRVADQMNEGLEVNEDVEIPDTHSKDIAHKSMYKMGFKHGLAGDKPMATDNMLMPGHVDAYKAGYKDGAAKAFSAQKESVTESIDTEHDPRTADKLEIGDPVVIAGDNDFTGHTGEISRFGKDKKFVVVKIHGGGEHSFHSDDVNEAEREDDEDSDDEDKKEVDKFYVAFYDENEERSWIGLISKEHGGKWHEKAYAGKPDYRWGKSYMAYLTPDDIMSWIHKDYSRQVEIEGPFYDASEAKEHVSHNWGKLPESTAESVELQSDSITRTRVTESSFTGYSDWKQAVLLSNPVQAKQIKFRAKMEGEKTTVTAVVPGEDKIYGEWDESTETGKVLSEVKRHVYGAGSEELKDHPDPMMRKLFKGPVTITLKHNNKKVKANKIKWFNGGSIWLLTEPTEDKNGKKTKQIDDIDTVEFNDKMRKHENK